MVQKYQNEIPPIFYYGISTKTSEEDLNIPNLQALTLGRIIKITLYNSALIHTRWPGILAAWLSVSGLEAAAQPYADQDCNLEGGQGGGDDTRRVPGDSHRLPQPSQWLVNAMKKSDTTHYYITSSRSIFQLKKIKISPGLSQVRKPFLSIIIILVFLVSPSFLWQNSQLLYWEWTSFIMYQNLAH